MVRNHDRPFMERMRLDRTTGELVEEISLRERLPAYVNAFLAGLLAIGVVGLVLSVLMSSPLSDSLGNSWIFGGAVLLLIGGANGGGLSNISIGALEAVAGGRNRRRDKFEEAADLGDGKVMHQRDQLARLRKGLRPPPNPTAFWQVIGGLAYIVIGLLTF